MGLGSLLRVFPWIAAVALATMSPRFADGAFRKAEALLTAFARRTAWCAATLAMTVLVVRALFLPVWGVPEPFVNDELGYLLQADTFASGRLTNPPHPMAEFFETAFILSTPTRQAKFPPAQGLVMGLGQLLGDPWIGVYLSCAALAGINFWALRGWLSPGWALFGAVLALPVYIFSYWMNSYWGGAVAAIGGALAYGAAPRLRSGRVLPAALLALGAVILALSRPFEGLVVLVPLVFMLRGAPAARVIGREAPSGSSSVPLAHARGWLRQALAGASVLTLGFGFLGYYNYRVTGSATTLPYVAYDREYPSNPHFNFLPLPPAKTYRQAGLTTMDLWERAAWAQSRAAGFVVNRITDLYARLSTLLGGWVLLVPVLFFGWWQAPRLRPLRWALLLMLAASFVEVVFYEHYAAPAFPALRILIVRAFRDLRQWKPAGLLLVRLTPIILLSLAILEPASRLARGDRLADPRASVIRATMERQLEEQFAEHLIFVHYSADLIKPEMWAGYSRVEELPLFIELVRNRADIDGSAIVWAYDLGPADNQRLIDYYKDRKVWRVEMSPTTQPELMPYR